MFVANLARAADLAAEHGIGILIEPLNRRDRPENLLHLPEQAAAIIEKVGAAQCAHAVRFLSRADRGAAI